MGDIHGYLRNGELLSPCICDGASGGGRTNMGRQAPFFAGESRQYIQEMARYSPNFFEAEIQGMDRQHPMRKRWYRIRVADIITNAVVGANMYDGWKTVYFEDPDVEELPRGAMLWFGGSCWLSVNPANIGGTVVKGIVRQCDAVWGKLDYYGNPVYIPFVRDKQATKANDNNSQQYTVKAQHYNNCIMARNEASRDLRENTRMVLGSSAYGVAGLNDSARDFTDDPESVKLMYFTIYRQEPTENDDMERGIADGKSFSWEISVSGSRRIAVGETVQLTASSLRCGAETEREVSYLWESSDETVLQVDGDGCIYAAGPGTAVIRCCLEQNPSIFRKVTIFAEERQDDRVEFLDTVPESLRQYQSVTLSAVVVRGGEPADEPVIFHTDGPDPGCYETNVNGNSLTVMCLYPSRYPLRITAEGGGMEAGAEIVLAGF